MKDINNLQLTEQDKIKCAMDHIAEACCFLFECESPAGEAAAFMADSLLKYANVIFNGDSPLKAACDYNAYEEEIYEKVIKSKNVINTRLKEINSELGLKE
jgi:hypothetical protein